MKGIRHLSQIAASSLLLLATACTRQSAGHASAEARSVSESSSSAPVQPSLSGPVIQPHAIETEDFALPLPDGYADVSSALQMEAPHLAVVFRASTSTNGYTPTIVVRKVPLPGGFRSRGVSVVGKTVYLRPGARTTCDSCRRAAERQRPALGTVRRVEGRARPSAERARRRVASARGDQTARELPGCGRGARGAAGFGRRHAGPFPDAAAVLVVLRARDRHALVVGLGAGPRRASGSVPRFSKRAGSIACTTAAEAGLQGRCDDASFSNTTTIHCMQTTSGCSPVAPSPISRS